ncbi:MAG: ATP-binding protein [Anaerolineae bacterium]
MFNSLRSRLILSYLLLIFLTLCIAGAGLLAFIQPYENARTSQRLVSALGSAAIEARTLVLDGVQPLDLVTRLQDELGDNSWRVLWLNDQRLILADSKGGMEGKALPPSVTIVAVTPRRFVTGAVALGGQNYLYAATTVAGRQNEARGILIVAALSRPFLGALEDLSSPLAGAGAIALVIAVLIGWLLARSISGPLNRLTRATEEVARGNYDERIPAEGRDEVGRLGVSFNAMTLAVKQSRQMQKDFVANLSHELKTPLTSVQGFAQAIAEGAFKDIEGARNAAQLIYEESLRMGRLVADLLTLARLDAGEVPMQVQTLDLAAMLPTWVDRFQQRAHDAGLTLSLTLNAPPPVQGDAGRLEQVVTNLIDNALKYNRPGGSIQVTAGGAQRPDPTASKRATANSRNWAVIRISDTGQGIPAVHIPRLFERFYRADKARVAGGSGLGLSIVKEIVDAHHGQIEVASQEGQGTTFTVWLPAK